MKSIGIKILVVDDEPNMLLSLEYLLKKQNYNVLLANNGTEAIELIKKHKPDLTLLDVMMPDIDGIQICEFIKSSPMYNHIKILFLTGKTDAKDIEIGLMAGAEGYLTKPFSIQQLYSKIEELLS